MTGTGVYRRENLNFVIIKAKKENILFWDLLNLWSTFHTKNVVLAGFVVPFPVQNYPHMLGLTE